MLFDPTPLKGPHAEKVDDLIRYDPLFQKLPTQLFTFDNGKTPKGEKQGYLTAIMYLAPYDLSGYLVCPFAELAQCHEPCLNTAGRGRFDSTQKARIRKTLMFHQFRDEFNTLLVSEMLRAIRKAKRMGLTLVVRLNGTSDILWENETISESWHTLKNRNIKWTIFDLFSKIQFYDYSKYPTRHKLPDNYNLTFSYSGVETFQPIVNKWRDRGGHQMGQNMAVVFGHHTMPVVFNNREVVNGDASDLRFLDGHNVVVGLTAKGNAKNDTTGFVVRSTA